MFATTNQHIIWIITVLLWFNLQYFTVLLLSKKINTVNTVKLVFYYKLEKSSFLFIFLKFAKTIYTY